jgi:hypothetical protein
VSQTDDHLVARQEGSSAGQFFLRYSGLRPSASYREIGVGICNCQTQLVTIYRNGISRMCAVCACLRQAYATSDTQALRLGLGCYLFISPKKTRFWGNHLMQRYNPAMDCAPATGQMTRIMQNMFVDPPAPPWMFISFGRSTGSDSLMVTTNTRIYRFSGDTEINRTPITEVNRDQVMRMVNAGIPRNKWDAYLDASYRCSVDDIATMRKLEAEYPILADFDALPPRNSPEHTALRWLLAEKRK